MFNKIRAWYFRGPVLRGWNAFEIAFLVLSIVLPLSFGLAFNVGFLSIVTSITFLVFTILLARGKAKSYVFGIVASVLYSVVAWQSGLYGEIIINIGISVPMYIYGIISWRRNMGSKKQYNQAVKPRRLPAKEWAVIVGSQLVMGVGYFFILSAFGTTFLILSVVAVIFNVVGEILMARRAHLGTAVYLPYIVTALVLWILISVNGETAGIPMIVMFSLLFLEDLYGYFVWRKLHKDCKEEMNLAGDGIAE